MAAAAMELDAGEDKPSEKELFLAAESGDADAFSSLAPADLAAALALRNEDGRSLLHVAAASGHPKAATPSTLS
jgi:26S proteasome non-ATPase regulatory subunit 10